MKKTKKMMVCMVVVIVLTLALATPALASTNPPELELGLLPTAGEGVVVTLPDGGVHFDMVEGTPGAARNNQNPTWVEVIEYLNNGYVKVMYGTTTYIIKSTDFLGKATTSSAPKTGEADMSALLTVIMILGVAGAAGAVFAGRKAFKGAC